jgi:hypothetical protein
LGRRAPLAYRRCNTRKASGPSTEQGGESGAASRDDYRNSGQLDQRIGYQYISRIVRRLTPNSPYLNMLSAEPGDLPASGNVSKAAYAAMIRNGLHVQLADLWNRNILLRALARTAGTIPNPGAGYYVGREPLWSPSASVWQQGREIASNWNGTTPCINGKKRENT